MNVMYNTYKYLNWLHFTLGSEFIVSVDLEVALCLLLRLREKWTIFTYADKSTPVNPVFVCCFVSGPLLGIG